MRIALGFTLHKENGNNSGFLQQLILKLHLARCLDTDPQSPSAVSAPRFRRVPGRRDASGICHSQPASRLFANEGFAHHPMLHSEAAVPDPCNPGAYVGGVWESHKPLIIARHTGQYRPDTRWWKQRPQSDAY